MSQLPGLLPLVCNKANELSPLSVAKSEQHRGCLKPLWPTVVKKQMSNDSYMFTKHGFLIMSDRILCGQPQTFRDNEYRQDAARRRYGLHWQLVGRIWP